MRERWRAAILGFFALAAGAAAQSAGDDWQGVVALDSGPKSSAQTLPEAKATAAGHLDRQERALRAFLKAHPGDEHEFEARLRLVRLLEIRGGFQGSDKARLEAQQLLAELEKTCTPEQRVEVDFAKVTRLMRGAQKDSLRMRDQLLAAARRFYTEHPGDRRVAALLTEVATLFDARPKIKESLLNQANSATTDPGLKDRIKDDLHRLDLLGQEVPLVFDSIQGKPVRLDDFRGKPVAVIFFADFSPPSTEALGAVLKSVAELPKESIGMLGIDLDPAREALDAVLKSSGFSGPVAFDGKSWEGGLVRSLGINALPTVWLFDKRGRLRTLNGLEGATEQLRLLLRE